MELEREGLYTKYEKEIRTGKTPLRQTDNNLGSRGEEQHRAVDK